MLAYMNTGSGIPPAWRLAAAFTASVSLGLCGFLLLRRPRAGRIAGGIAAFCSFLTSLPYLLENPVAALLGMVCLISAGFTLLDFRLGPAPLNGIVKGACLQRTRWAALTVSAAVGFSIIVSERLQPFVIQCTLATSALMALLMFMHWAWRMNRGVLRAIYTAFGLCFAGALMMSLFFGHTRAAALAFTLTTVILLFRSMPMGEGREHWWETLFNHPARLLLSTFFFLCFMGFLLLLLPNVTGQGGIAFVDAAFTSVSAVCVTGLIVLDTPGVFTFFGQALILLLIQLGGLGIMSIAAVALHAIGRRLSLRQESVLTTMTDSDHKGLTGALIRILKFTFFAEAIGSLILAALFYFSGDPLGKAVWRGLFTAISAFCNAGFSLQSNSMIPYQNSPLILQTVAALIIFGGMAPATSLLAPNWLMGRRIPLAPRIALITTAVMLVSGMVFFLAFEWNGVLSGLSLGNKIHNAWFQSATLRTAGFNSVDVAGVVSPTFMVMILFMFIGGSPGGTAGGVKTTTIGILVMTFWANINNRNSIVFQNRRVPSAIIYRAITIVACFAVVWFGATLMLEVTQTISGRDLIFEVTSAIGTVGLSTGATARLDEMGKIIIMMTMFAGRIGPMTLFMLLSEDVSVPEPHCADAKINLT